MQLTATHYISLAVTLLVTLLPGLLAARRVKSADDYNVGRPQLGRRACRRHDYRHDYRWRSYRRHGAAWLQAGTDGLVVYAGQRYRTFADGGVLCCAFAPQLAYHCSGISRYGLRQACGVVGDLQRLRRYFFQHRSEHADGFASHCRFVRRTTFGCSSNCYRCYFVAGVFRRPQQQRHGRHF